VQSNIVHMRHSRLSLPVNNPSRIWTKPEELTAPRIPRLSRELTLLNMQQGATPLVAQTTASDHGRTQFRVRPAPGSVPAGSGSSENPAGPAIRKKRRLPRYAGFASWALAI